MADSDREWFPPNGGHEEEADSDGTIDESVVPVMSAHMRDDRLTVNVVGPMDTQAFRLFVTAIRDLWRERDA